MLQYVYNSQYCHPRTSKKPNTVWSTHTHTQKKPRELNVCLHPYYIKEIFFAVVHEAQKKKSFPELQFSLRKKYPHYFGLLYSHLIHTRIYIPYIYNINVIYK